MKNIVIECDESYTDLIPEYIGEEKCESGHSFGPYVRTSYLIHYCLSGKGILCDSKGKHEVSKGEMFIIRPHEVTTYTADLEDPWHYVWIGFSGTHAKVFSSLASVMPVPEAPFSRLVELVRRSESSPRAYAALLHDLIYGTVEGVGDDGDKISSIRRYIDYNYMKNINMEELSSVFVFDRSYIYRMFISRYGISPKEYLTEVRMRRAKELLSLGYRVSECAAMVGYTDPFIFSRSFTRAVGVPPNVWRSEAIHTKNAAQIADADEGEVSRKK